MPMHYVFIEQSSLLDVLENSSFAESPEELLERIESALESGELSITEALEYLQDLGLNTHQRK